MCLVRLPEGVRGVEGLKKSGTGENLCRFFLGIRRECWKGEIFGIDSTMSLQGLRTLLQTASQHFDRTISALDRLVAVLVCYRARHGKRMNKIRS